MGFCTWGNEVPFERGRICQNCRDWFAISRKLVQTFFVEFHFFMETMLFSYFLFGRWSKFISFFLANVLWCPFLKNHDDDGPTFLSHYSWFFRFHENWKMKKYKNTRNNLIESALVTTIFKWNCKCSLRSKNKSQLKSLKIDVL